MFDQNFVLLAEHHYLQTLSDDSIASLPSLLSKANKVSKVKAQGKLDICIYAYMDTLNAP